MEESKEDKIKLAIFGTCLIIIGFIFLLTRCSDTSKQDKILHDEEIVIKLDSMRKDCVMFNHTQDLIETKNKLKVLNESIKK